jgi:hypothetical protein
MDLSHLPEITRGLVSRHASRRGFEAREVKVAARVTLIRMSWDHNTISRWGNTEDRKIVMWAAWADGEYVITMDHKGRAVDLALHVAHLNDQMAAEA